MTNKLFGAALAALALSASGAAIAQRAPAAVIVVIDTQRIYAECTACRTAQATLQQQATSIQQLAQSLGAPLQTEAQALQTAIKALNGKPADAALTARAQALDGRRNAAAQQIQGREQSFQSTQQNVLNQINVRLKPIINQVMVARGANIALDAGATMDNTTAVDVTADVLTRLNASLTTINVVPLPQPAAPAAGTAQQPQGR